MCPQPIPKRKLSFFLLLFSDLSFNSTYFTSKEMGNLDYVNQLNEYQKEAVTAEDKYLQVLAGPGSGKTRGKSLNVNGGNWN